MTYYRDTVLLIFAFAQFCISLSASTLQVMTGWFAHIRVSREPLLLSWPDTQVSFSLAFAGEVVLAPSVDSERCRGQ